MPFARRVTGRARPLWCTVRAGKSFRNERQPFPVARRVMQRWRSDDEALAGIDLALGRGSMRRIGAPWRLAWRRLARLAWPRRLALRRPLGRACLLRREHRRG